MLLLRTKQLSQIQLVAATTSNQRTDRSTERAAKNSIFLSLSVFGLLSVQLKLCSVNHFSARHSKQEHAILSIGDLQFGTPVISSLWCLRSRLDLAPIHQESGGQGVSRRTPRLFDNVFCTEKVSSSHRRTGKNTDRFLGDNEWEKSYWISKCIHEQEDREGKLRE